MYKEKKSKISFLLSVLAVILCLGLIGGAYMAFTKQPIQTETVSTDTVIGEQGETVNDGKVHSLPSNMLFSVKSFAENLGDGNDGSEPVNVILSANVFPINAKNKAVDWSLRFADADSDWASGKTLSDYVTVTPKTDGASVATVSCYQAFGEPIILTVTSRDNPDVTATCNIGFKQQLTGLEIALSQEGKDLMVSNFVNWGVVCADFENENPLIVEYDYHKSDVYTVALNDDEIAPPILMVEYSLSLTNALNYAKEGSAKVPVAEKEGAGCSVRIFCKDFIDGYMAEDVNEIIDALVTYKANSVKFIFTDGKGSEIACYSFSIDTSAIEDQIKVTNITLGDNEFVFGEDVETYNIFYKLADNYVNVSLFETGSEYGLSKKADGYYPDTYTAGESVVISDLEQTFTCSGSSGEYHSGNGGGKAGYQFKGWYLDKSKTVAFDGVIPAGTVGDITLYADIVMRTSHISF